MNGFDQEDRRVPERRFKPYPNTFIGRINNWMVGNSWKGYRRVVLSLLERDPTAKFLDLGCSNGDFTEVVAGVIGTRDIHGIDLRGDVLIEAQQRIGLQGYIGDLNDNLPIPDTSFDVVTALQVIEHLSNTSGFLREIGRIMKPAGYAIISTPNLAAWHNILFLLIGRQPPVASVDDTGPYGWPMHLRLFTARGLVGVLGSLGFKIEELRMSGYHPLPDILARMVSRVDRVHSGIITVKVRK